MKVARLNCLIDKIQNESGETPGFLHEWLDGDEESKRSVERRVKRMFKLYESKGTFLKEFYEKRDELNAVSRFKDKSGLKQQILPSFSGFMSLEDRM